MGFIYIKPMTDIVFSLPGPETSINDFHVHVHVLWGPSYYTLPIKVLWPRWSISELIVHAFYQMKYGSKRHFFHSLGNFVFKAFSWFRYLYAYKAHFCVRNKLVFISVQRVHKLFLQNNWTNFLQTLFKVSFGIEVLRLLIKGTGGLRLVLFFFLYVTIELRFFNISRRHFELSRIFQVLVIADFISRYLYFLVCFSVITLRTYFKTFHQFVAQLRFTKWK